MLNEANQYFERVGLKSILWLKEKSKRPVAVGWTKKSVAKDFSEIEREYKDGMNLGVRLGRAARLSNGQFLAVLDVDIKSKDARHRMEAAEALSNLTGLDLEALLKATWVSRSGRGNGSLHVFVTTKVAATPKMLLKSKDVVKVAMPSVPPNAREKETLSAEEISEGLRLRAAWEISLMGEGQQVVLPPSIHPDTGRKYKWVTPPTGKAPVEFQIAEAIRDGEASDDDDEDILANFEPLENVDLSRLPDSVVNKIVSGVGVQDRSAALFGVVMAMREKAYTEREILSVLTDERYFLGAVGFDHTGSRSRKRAADWVRRFTLKKAKNAAQGRSDFEVIEDGSVLVPSGSGHGEENRAELLEAVGDWRSRIERNKAGAPLSTFSNAKLILENLIDGGIQNNEFTMNDTWTTDMPWGSRAGEHIQDVDVLLVKSYLVDHFRVEVATKKIEEILIVLAKKKSFHPIRDYLKGLSWDGQERLDDWLHTYLGAKSTPYTRMAGRKTLTAMVARILHPGIAFHHALILQGEQRRGKSVTWKILAGKEYHTDVDLDINRSDTRQMLLGKWVVELGELSTTHRAGVNAMKNFISSDVDEFRRPYGRFFEKRARQFIFVGTTNQDQYLRDITGNARFWPIEVEQLKYDDLIRDRDQLLAEALVHYECRAEQINFHPRWFLDAIQEETESRSEFLDTEARIIEILNNPSEVLGNTVRCSDIRERLGPVRDIRSERGLQMLITKHLKKMGYRHVKIRVGNATFWAWRK